MDTFPLLLTPSDLSSSTLVLWSQAKGEEEKEEEEGGGSEAKEIAELRDTFSEFTFAWINWSVEMSVQYRGRSRGVMGGS